MQSLSVIRISNILRVLDLLASNCLLQGVFQCSDNPVEILAFLLYNSDAHVPLGR